MAQKTSGTLPRSILAKIFTDPRALLAFDDFQKQVAVALPTAVNQAQDTADGAQISADVAQFDASSALSLATALQGPSYVVLASSTALNNEAVLQGGAGVTLPFTLGTVTIVVNVPTALGYTPANRAGDAFTGSVSVAGQMECTTLRVDQTPTATATASTHSIPVNINGATYYMRLSSTP